MGTDTIAGAAIEKAWRSLGLHPDLKIKHMFFCENSTPKCDILQKSFPEVPHIYRDVKHMGSPLAMCYKCNEKHEVPSNLDICIAGFSCKSLSSLNATKKSIADRTGSTGETLAGLLSYAKVHRPKLLIMENVMGIVQAQQGGENMMKKLKRMMKCRGYHGAHIAVNSMDYLLPQSRNRVWMFFVRTEREQFVPKAVATVAAFRQQEHFELEHLVNPNTMAKLGGRATPCEAKIKYVDVRDKFAKEHGLDNLDSPQKRNRACSLDPKIGRLPITQRMRHALLLKMAHLRKQGEDVDTAAWVLQLDQEVHRMATQRRVSPCVTPKGIYYVTNLNKIMNGVDAASVQGLTLPDLKLLKMHDVEDALLRDCVGNAFSLPVAIISIVAALQDLGSADS